MRRLLPLVLLLVAACGGGAITSTPPGQATATAPTGSGSNGISPAPVATTQATTAAGGAIPADCAAGFTAYLKLIEPVVASLKPSAATLGDFFTADEAASEKGIEAMTANGGAATYSCSDAGLEFNYFDSSSPWPAILDIAAAAAPGTVAYLQVHQQVSAIDIQHMSDFGATSCDDAVARVNAAISQQMGGGKATVADVGIDAGIALLGLYRTYLSDVQDGKCPPDKLGNDAFDFFGALG